MTEMKRLFNIFMTCVAVAALAGCNDNAISPAPQSSYIFFDSQVDTKGELVSDMQEKDFGVTAYKYKGYWETVSGGQMKPNVFHCQRVLWNETSHEYDASDSPLNPGGTPLVPWEGNGLLYTFFAYYPYDKVTASGLDVDGEPYVDYHLDHSDRVEDVDNSHSNSVGLTMKHRLSAIDVHVYNYINDVNGKAVTVKVTELSVTYDNLLYSDVSLWMDPEYKPDGSVLDPGVRTLTKAGSPSATFSILSGADAVSVPNEGRLNVTGGNGKTMIVIPQKKTDGSYLKGKVSFKFSFHDDEGRSVAVPLINDSGDGTVDVTSGERNDVPFDMQKDILEGQKYYIQLIFMNGLITLNAVSDTYWEDKNIDIEFE